MTILVTMTMTNMIVMICDDDSDAMTIYIDDGFAHGKHYHNDEQTNEKTTQKHDDTTMTRIKNTTIDPENQDDNDNSDDEHHANPAGFQSDFPTEKCINM